MNQCLSVKTFLRAWQVDFEPPPVRIGPLACDERGAALPSRVDFGSASTET